MMIITLMSIKTVVVVNMMITNDNVHVDTGDGDNRDILLPVECYFPLGMENMKIDNAQITSSSVFGLHKAYYGRLNLLSFHGDPARSAWCASTKDKDPYLEVDFGQATTVSGVAVQGLSLFDNFVTSFRLCYSNDRKNFECVQEEGNDKVSLFEC